MRGNLNATHLPFLLDEEHSPSGLLGHFARRNESLAELPDGEEVMAILPGPMPTFRRVCTAPRKTCPPGTTARSISTAGTGG